MSSRRTINTDLFSAQLRSRGVDLEHRRVLLSRLTDSQQASDLTLPTNCRGFGRIHHFYRDQGSDWPANPLPIDPAAHWLRLPPSTPMLQVQVFQNAICSWRCWYCYVDYDLLSGNLSRSQFVSANELVDLYASDSPRLPVIDLSGGQPDLVPEWILWMAEEIHSRKWDRNVFLWSDDNLSNDYMWRYLSSEDISRLASYPFYCRVGCFKGFDPESFAFNTQAAPDMFSRQFELMRRLVEAGFQVYGYVTFTSESGAAIESKMAAFVDRLQAEIHPNFPLRVAPLRIREFSPTTGRMNESRQRALGNQYEAVHAWIAELNKRFSDEQRSKRVYEHVVRTS